MGDSSHTEYMGLGYFYLKDHYLHSVAIGAMLIPYNAWYGGEHEPQPKK